ncbi:GNAT family N-acetyltransferase [Allostreptomyces psammosilenae]|uniref:GNAT superfamily N-acetyltransferase n=1 Tax=Allostreptomyces psammosilenae TaxID=1892865 RepID=A0A852ZXE0_9ACTN|nr:GNAT family N-acetyltransferase [Allostreptomyces psammosilenae]NYI07016.1 GNAT superfamily N-acetyltransferase [Allostreptomyces psammosilenae]
MRIRPLTPSDQDVTAADALAERSFAALFASMGRPPAPERPDEEASLARARYRHLITTDPGGAWAAEDSAGALLGLCLATLRDGLWGLSLLVVDPASQSRGVGRALLERALGHGAEPGAGGGAAGRPLPGLIISSADPRAARRYHSAGFALAATTRFAGPVDRTRLPARPEAPVREGGAGDLGLVERVDLAARGHRRGRDPEVLLRGAALVVTDGPAGSGYALRRAGRILGAAGTTPVAARAVLTEALAGVPEGTDAAVNFVAGEQAWAVDVCLGLRLVPRAEGWLATRGFAFPGAYLPNGSYL